jgi:hypothetical protein
MRNRFFRMSVQQLEMEHRLEDEELGYIQVAMPVNDYHHFLCGSRDQALMRMSGKNLRAVAVVE